MLNLYVFRYFVFSIPPLNNNRRLTRLSEKLCGPEVIFLQLLESNIDNQTFKLFISVLTEKSNNGDANEGAGSVFADTSV